MCPDLRVGVNFVYFVYFVYFVVNLCDESRPAEERVNLGHPFADRDFLRTILFAVVAGNANIGPSCFQDKAPARKWKQLGEW